jgi:hypothetical protein
MSKQTQIAEPIETKRRPEIVASEELWQRFDAWCERQGCTTLAEGIRTAIRIVTNFNNESQGEIAQINNNNSGKTDKSCGAGIG